MRNLIFCLSGIALFLVACAGSDRSPKTTATNSQGSSDTAANPAPFSDKPPMVSDTTDLRQPIKVVPGLTPPTNPDQRANLVAEKIAAGRHDPFAPVPGTSLRILPSAGHSTAATAAPPVNVFNPPTIGLTPLLIPPPPPIVHSQLPLVGVPQTNQSVPRSSGQQSPTHLPTLPPQTSSGSSQIPVQVAPAAPVSLAQAVKVTGVVQVKGKLSAIVQVPQEQSPRSVQVGEYLANGTIRVKQIRMNPNQEPVVILEENGQTVTRAVGG